MHAHLLYAQSMPIQIPVVLCTTVSYLVHAPLTGKVLAGVCCHGLGLSRKLSWSPKRASTPGDTYVRISSSRNVWQYNAGGVFNLARFIHHVFLLAACTSYGQSMSRRVLAWSRASTEATTPGDTRLPRVQARTWQFL